MTTEKIQAVVEIATLFLMYHGIAQSNEQKEVADELLDKAIDNLAVLTDLKVSVIVGIMDKQLETIKNAIYNVEQDSTKDQQ